MWNMTTPILTYPFNTAEIGEDVSGNATDLTNVGVVFAADPVVGTVASFDGSSFLNLAAAADRSEI